MQDFAAASYDLTQTIGAQAFVIGEGALQLLRFGPNEARLTGDLRVDGIVRALGGLYAGAFTTAQRDAIPAGRAPFGLIILNTNTVQYEWNRGSDGARQWSPLGGTIYGLRSDRPAANTMQGQKYFAVDIVAEFFSDGSTWYRLSKPAGAVEEISYAVADPGYVLADGASYVKTLASMADLNAVYSANGYPYGSTTTNFTVPDRRGRVGVGVVSGGKTEVNALGKSEGVILTRRNISHHHLGYGGGPDRPPVTTTEPGGGFERFTSGDGDNLDKPAFLVVNYEIKL